MSTINESTMQRLAFIKYLYTKAVSESHQAEPLSASSILTFHDSIELFLQIASEFAPLNNLGIKKNNKPDFMDYWDLVSVQTANGRLSQEESMRQLNKARVALKHHGVVPSKLHTESFRATATAFFSENTKTAFGIEFDDISMLNLVIDQDVRTALAEAKKNFESGNKAVAIENVAVAFVKLLRNYEKSKIHHYHSPFSILKDQPPRRPRSHPITTDKERAIISSVAGNMVDQAIEMLYKDMQNLEQAIKLLGFGINLKRYTKFKLFVPNVTRTSRGNYIQQSRVKSPESLTNQEFQFCFDFVIESALRLQEFDFEVDEEMKYLRRRY